MPVLIGSVNVTIDGLADKKDFQLINPATNLPAGYLVFEDKKIHDEPTFMSYLKDGWNIQVTMAIDYTHSNKPWNQPDSLHYI